MKNEYEGLKMGFIKVIVYSIIVVSVAEFIKWDALSMQGSDLKFSEASYTEYMQSFLLLLSSLIYIYVFRKVSSIKPLSLVLFAFCFASLIREQDSFLDDYVFDGAWQSAVSILLAVVFYYTYRNWKQLLQNINVYVRANTFGLFISGVLTTYLFSRLYGRTQFWTAVMEDRYFRVVKTTSEECIELYGYSILLVAAVEFLFVAREQTSKQN